MKDFMYAAIDEATWREIAIAQGIGHVVTDEEDLPLLVYNEGFHADHIGAVGSDTRFHVNLRVLGDDVEREFIRSKRYKPLSETGVEWVDPETVTSPQRAWMGGMDYFAENVPDLVPVNISPPFISDVLASPGDLLTCAPGIWSGNPDIVTYQWMRDAGPINQAITPNHTVRLADVGHTLTCVETAKNSAGEASTSSNGITVS